MYRIFYLFVLITTSLLAACFAIYYWLFRKKENSPDPFLEAPNSYLQDIDLQEEKKARKLWLNAFILQSLPTPIAFFSLGMFFYLKDFSATHNILPFPIFSLIIALLCLLLWLTYYWIYKKRGTKLLLFQMIAIPLSFFQSFSAKDFDPVVAIICLPLICLTAFYWVACVSLRKFNLIRKRAKRLASKAISQATSESPSV